MVVSPLQLLILLQLNEGEKYGYEILKVLREEFEGVWELRTGTFYPALRSLETRGFLETNLRDDTEFYSLTEKGKTLLERLGKHFELEYKFVDRYFKAIVKWMPISLKDKLLRVIQTLSKEDVDVYSNLRQFFDDTMDSEKKFEVLNGMRSILKTRIITVDKLLQEITDCEGT